MLTLLEDTRPLGQKKKVYITYPSKKKHPKEVPDLVCDISVSIRHCTQIHMFT